MGAHAQDHGRAIFPPAPARCPGRLFLGTRWSGGMFAIMLMSVK